MKSVITLVLVLCLALTAVGCSATEPAPIETTPAKTSAVQIGIYTGSVTYVTETFSMDWNFAIHFQEDGTFTLINDAGEEKGAGTYTHDTLTYTDERTCTFIINNDGTLKLTAPLPYGIASIDPAQVGEILLTFVGTQTDADTSATA